MEEAKGRRLKAKGRTFRISLFCVSGPQPSTLNPQPTRRRWESNPLNAVLQAAATPCDFSVGYGRQTPLRGNGSHQFTGLVVNPSDHV